MTPDRPDKFEDRASARPAGGAGERVPPTPRKRAPAPPPYPFREEPPDPHRWLFFVILPIAAFLVSLAIAFGIKAYAG